MGRMIKVAAPQMGPVARDESRQRVVARLLEVMREAGCYQNATWAVGVAKCGDEEGFNMIGQSCIVAPSGEIVAQCSSIEDEVVVHKCDLDAAADYKRDIFNFAYHRQPQHHRLIVERTTGAERPPA